MSWRLSGHKLESRRTARGASKTSFAAAGIIKDVEACLFAENAIEQDKCIHIK